MMTATVLDAADSGTKRTSTVLLAEPCASHSVLYSCVAPPGVAFGVGPHACRPNPRRCTCVARTRCGTPNTFRPIRSPNRCYSRRICATGTYSGPSSWPKWPKYSNRTEWSAIPVTLPSATNTIRICSSGSFPRRYIIYL